MEKTDTIALVNGTKITKQELDMQIAQLVYNPNIQTPDPSDEKEYPQFIKAVAEQLVNDALIYEDAKKQEFKADEAKVESEYQVVAGKFETPEAFTLKLAEVGLSEESLKENIARQLIVDQYYKQLFDKNNISASDEDAQKLYDEHMKGKEDVPEFDKVKDQIKTELQQQQLQQALGGILQELRKGANVEIKI